MLDLGGGSMQLVGVRDRRAQESGSWRVGAVRMTERFLPNGGPAKPRQIEALREHVAQELQSATWLAKTGRRLVGIGGTVRGLAAVAQRAEGLPSNGVQGMTVTREALGEIIERLAALAPSQRASVPGVKPSRADLILAGAVVVEGALRAGGFDALEATEAGLREGVFFERHLSSKKRGPAPRPSAGCATLWRSRRSLTCPLCSRTCVGRRWRTSLRATAWTAPTRSTWRRWR